MLFVCSVAWLFLLGCQYQCKWLTGVSSQKLPISVDGDVKPHSLTHLLTHCTCIRVGLRLLHCALSIVAQCIVIGPVCGGRMGGRRAVFVAGGVRYHDNSQLRASIFTKLGLYVQVVTISSWLNFGGPAPPGRGLRRGEILALPSRTLYVYGGLRRARSLCVSLNAVFHFHQQNLISCCQSHISPLQKFHQNLFTTTRVISIICIITPIPQWKNSFKKFQDPQPDPEKFQNLMATSLSRDTSLVFFQWISNLQFLGEVANRQTDKHCSVALITITGGNNNYWKA